MCIQLNLGRHTTSSSSSSSSRSLQFIVVVLSETNLMTVSGSRSRWTVHLRSSGSGTHVRSGAAHSYSSLSAGVGKVIWLEVVTDYYGCCYSDPCMFFPYASMADTGRCFISLVHYQDFASRCEDGYLGFMSCM